MKSDGGDKKKNKDPNAPKQPCTAYIFYSNTTRDRVREANPELSYNDIMKLIGQNFKALSPEERAPWNDKAAADKERYQKEMAEYSATNQASDIKGQKDVPLEKLQDKPSSAKKRKKPAGVSAVSAKSANLLAAFLKSKKQKTE